MSVKLKTPSNGSVTLAPEDTASDVTLTVPAVAGEILNDQSDIETQVKSATNATGDAPIFACRAWCNFDGTGTPSIRASGNVSSITDNGTGDYTVNFTTAMPDVNYAVLGNCDQNGATFNLPGGGFSLSTTSARGICGTTVTRFDASVITASFFR
jgi:hypothetical protein